MGYAVETDEIGRLTGVLISLYNPTDTAQAALVTARADGHSSYACDILLSSKESKKYMVLFSLPVDLSNVRNIHIRLIEKEPPQLRIRPP